MTTPATNGQDEKYRKALAKSKKLEKRGFRLTDKVKKKIIKLITTHEQEGR